MNLFIDKNHRRKSPIAIAGFFATLLDLCIYGVLYTLLAEPLYTGTLPVKVDKSFSSDDCEVIDGENYCYTLYVTAVNGAMYRLPNTGGSGFSYIPIVLCILGAAMYISIKKTDDRKDNIHEKT